MKKYAIADVPNELASILDEYKMVFGSLTPYIELEVFQTRELIISFNKPIDKLRFMIQGRAKISFVHEDGKQSIVHFAQKGEYLGELTFLEIEKEHKNVAAISECVFIAVNMSSAKKILTNDAKFLYDLNQFIGKKMLKRTYFNSKNQNYELKNRLAAYIILSQNKCIYIEKHTETAEYLGVSYRHLLYTFKEFIDGGMLIKQKKGYKVDMESLENLSKDIEMNKMGGQCGEQIL